MDELMWKDVWKKSFKQLPLAVSLPPPDCWHFSENYIMNEWINANEWMGKRKKKAL